MKALIKSEMKNSMGYLYILISLLAGSTKGFMGKKISNKVSGYRQSVFVNSIRMVLCTFISLLFFGLDTAKTTPVFDGEALLYGGLAGISMSVFIITWLLAVRYGAFMLISVAQMFGVVVTLLCNFIVFREVILPRQMIAVGFLIASVLIMVSYSSSIKGKLSSKAILLLVLCGFSNGIYDFSLKLFTHFSKSSISTLNLITYLLSAVGLLLILALTPKSDSFDGKTLFKDVLWPIIVMSVCLFLSSQFKAMANHHLSATVIYPLYQAGGLILSALMSAIFFKEKITPRCIIGLVMTFVAILLLK